MAGSGNRIGRKEAVGMENLVSQFIREMKLESGINQVRVKEAWNTVSGAARYTLSVSYVGTYVYVTLSSSMARNQLYYQKDVLMKKMNEFLTDDTLFVANPKGGAPVTNIVMK